MTKKQQEEIRKLREGIDLIKCKYRLKLAPLEHEIKRLKEENKCLRKLNKKNKSICSSE